MRLRQVFLWSMVVSLGLDAVLGIAALLLPSRGPVWQLLGSAALFAGFSLVALLCAIVLERQRLVPLMWAGIGCAGAALVPWLAMIWLENRLQWQAHERLAKVGGTFTVAAIIIAQVGLVSLPRLQGRPARLLRSGTRAAAILLGAYVIALFWWWDGIERVIDDDLLLRALGVLIIVSLCGTVVTPIIWKVQALRRDEPAESIPAGAQIQVTCPRCGLHKALLPGRAACAGCGLLISVKVEEPRCACGYLLHGPPGERCPECGGAGLPESAAVAPSRGRARAALAAGILPAILLVVLVSVSGNVLRGGWAQPVPAGPYVPPPTMQTSSLNGMILQYCSSNAGSAPRHAIELALSDAYRYSWSSSGRPFCNPGTRTTEAQVPVGDGTLAAFGNAGRTEQVRIISRTIEAMPAGLVAYRLGDFVFPDLGTVPVASNPQLWTVLMLPDPDVNGPLFPDDPIYIGTAGYTVLEATAGELPAMLSAQNRVRRALGLPPLPDDLAGVTHARPALAPAS